MTPERWQEIKKVLADAMDLPVSDREAFVDRVSAHDEELRREVLSLLSAAESSGEVVNTARMAVVGDRALHAILATALGQQYEIVRPLGQGGMGAVYLARERALERFVAIKVLRPDLADAPGSRERFRREARVAAQLTHAGILPLHTFGEVNGIWYFVMGYVRGVSLAERLRLEGRLPSDEAQRILAELADALETAHRHGVIHRDIKPANILLDDETGRAMLADFGIAKVHGAGDNSLTGTGVVIGTPHYMSPEQALGASTVDERSDIYSLGAVAYTMLAGREPFTGSTPQELAFRRLSQDPPPLETLAPSVPPDLAAIVMRCLAREPAERWQNARSLRDALARASGDALATIPESLRDLPAFGPYALLWAAALTALAIGSDGPAGDRVLLVLIALLVPFGFVLHLWNVGRPHLGWTGIARVAFWPPDWWGMWWPRALRRPTDLWRRLPRPARAVRISISMFLIILPSMILLREEIQSAVGEGAADWLETVQSLLVIGVAIATVGGLLWAYRHGLSGSETVRLLFGATVPSPSWTSPGIVKLLHAASGSARPPGHETPGEYRRAILELLTMLSGFQPESRTLVTTTTNRLYAEIEACDAEIHALDRDASTAEVERLTARLATLELEAQHGSPRHELHGLVRRELHLIREMRVGAEVISQGRARLYSLMRGVWAQLCLVRDNPGDTASLIDRITRLCDEISLELTTTQSEANSRLSQARAVAHSRLTVAGEISRASAVSSMFKPPK